MVLYRSASVSIPEKSVIDFGNKVAGREVDAGKIGYSIKDTGKLNVIGGGTAIGNRQVVISDDVEITGKLKMGRFTLQPSGDQLCVSDDSKAVMCLAGKTGVNRMELYREPGNVSQMWLWNAAGESVKKGWT